MRWRFAALAAALVAALVAVVLVAPAGWVVSAGAAPGCTVLQVRNIGPGSVSALYQVVLPAADSTGLGMLEYRMNALGYSGGYSGSQGLVYGMAERGPFGRFPDGAHVVALDRVGRAHDLGPVRAAARPLTAPKAGAIKGNRWYVGDGGFLYAVDVDPTSATYLSVLSMTAIQPWHGPFALDDFDVDPVDGELYGVSMTHHGLPAVVRIDRGSGRVSKLADAPGLPPSGYGSVVIGPDRALYVTANQVGGLYRVSRDGSVTRLATMPPMSSSDAAGCLRQTPPPSPPPPQPPTTTPSTQPPLSTTLAPTPTPTRPSQSSTAPTPSRIPPSTLPTSARSSPAPPPEPGAYAPPTHEPGADHAGHDTKEKRRWALAMLLLLIGGSAAVRRLR
ncbi:hypothetical protein [Saccharopolyspora sp. ASAGF58]|uniref:DUF6923 family protein n=1 Tax=Saccharopolyspora sp. ASAGF58 TaxID=2719023 RepID=UPI00143FD961|nr:hypothetical protein [Saccharopolyspora sp. ASAGF58]QIZ39005.1 hypothetical protein FDZ84_36575 [Saccharopolyspora sp. ASAGF58]